jgi:dihydroorotate dehydrogenase
VLKLPVDLDRDNLKPLLEIAKQYHVNGVIISNLTKDRTWLQEKDTIDDIPWWVSGKILTDRSDYLIWETYKHYGNDFVIIWVWGIFTAEDAYNKIKQGASLLQLITGMIFAWPQRIAQIHQWIVKLLHQDWYTHISQAIWAAHRG